MGFGETIDHPPQKLNGWQFLGSGEITQVRSETIRNRSQCPPTHAAEVKCIRHVTLDGTTTFENVVSDGLPVVLKGLHIGPCTHRWTLDYISKQLGEDRKVCGSLPR